MSSWELKKLSEVADIIGGATPKSDVDEYFNGDIPWITPKDLSGYKNRYISKGERNITKLGLENSSAKLLPKGAVLFTSRAPIGYVAIADNEVSTNQGFKSLVLKDGNIPEFFYYLLKHNIPLFEARATGSTFKEVSGQVVKNTELLIPSIDIQKKIVDLVSPLDEKIELNTQINQTLEQIAQTIFKSWFIDFAPVHAKANALASGQTAEQATQAAMAVISGKNTQELHRLQTANPEQYQQLWEIADAFPSGVDEEGVPWGWEERELSYLFEFLSGAQPPKSEHIYEEKEGYERFIQNRDYSNDNHKTYIPISKKNKRCTEKDILMDKYGEAGKVRYGIKGAYNVALAKIVPQKDNLREFLRSYFTQDKIRNYLSSSSMASTRNSLNSTTFTRMKVIVPNDFLLSTFDKLANEKIDKILQIKQENIELSKLRDYLLPKLLSGEV